MRCLIAPAGGAFQPEFYVKWAVSSLSGRSKVISAILTLFYKIAKNPKEFSVKLAIIGEVFMSFTISDGFLRQGNRRVDFVKSIFTSGAFASSPKIAVIHYTAGASARSSADWFRNRDNKGSSAHVVVDRDGSVIQCVAFDTIAWHAGKSRWRNVAGTDLVGLNQTSFGIELANWGDLRPTGNGWASHTGVPIADPVLAVHRNGNPPNGSRTPIGWEPFPRAQIETAAGIVRALIASYGVNEIVGHDDIAPVRKSDPGPAFDMTRFRTWVFGGRQDDGDTLVKVNVANGLNLRNGPGTQFAMIETLVNGTMLEPREADGNWLQVNVLNAAGAPRATGWVNSGFTTIA